MNEGKVILIIGASGGLGRNIIPAIQKKGYKVIGHYKDQLENTVDGVEYFQGDIRKEEDVKSIIEKAFKLYGRIDVLVNAAGVTQGSISWKTSIEEWQNTIDVNLTGSFLTIKHVLPLMRENNFGRIINISSVVAQTGTIGTCAYAASKAGLIGMVKSIAKEVSNKNITVNNIALGYFNKGMIDTVPDEMRKEIIQQIPKKELGDVEELAECIVYLSGDKASYITGETINLNGGMYA